MWLNLFFFFFSLICFTRRIGLKYLQLREALVKLSFFFSCDGSGFIAGK